MSTIISREFRNYVRNPLHWIGILVMFISIYSCLTQYLDVRLFTSEQEVKTLDVVRPMDADVMNGYIPTTAEEQLEIGLEDIRKIFKDAYEMTEQEAEQAIRDVKAQNLSISQTIQYLEEQYGFYDGKAVFLEAKQKKATMNEMNSYMKSKLTEHSYAYYFAKKYADFAGLHIAFFSCVMLAFLFRKDLKKDIYELLHTKPISAGSYVWGKFVGGLLPLTFALLMITIVFTVVCQYNELQTGGLDSVWNMFLALFLYVMPTVLIGTGIYVLLALLFRNPLPALPLLLAYIVYSNMGGYNQNGNYGFQGRILGMLFRFEGKFFETVPQPIFLWNQIGLLTLTVLFVSLGIRCWRKKRV